MHASRFFSFDGLFSVQERLNEERATCEIAQIARWIENCGIAKRDCELDLSRRLTFRGTFQIFRRPPRTRLAKFCVHSLEFYARFPRDRSRRVFTGLSSSVLITSEISCAGHPDFLWLFLRACRGASEFLSAFRPSL